MFVACKDSISHFTPADNTLVLRLRRIAQELTTCLTRHPEQGALASLYDDVVERLRRAEEAEQGVRR